MNNKEALEQAAVIADVIAENNEKMSELRNKQGDILDKLIYNCQTYTARCIADKIREFKDEIKE